jgi:hypothetical protein
VHVSRRVVWASTVLAAAAATAGAAGMAFASWATTSTSDAFTVYAARMPRIGTPAVAVRTAPRITWTPVELASGVPVHQYVVTRHLGPVRQIACDVPATAVARCIDANAPAGYAMTYTVAARYGSRWVGPASEPSSPVIRPGVAVPISVNGVTILPGPDGAVVVSEPALSASAEVPEQPDGEPSLETSAPGEVTTEEPAVVPPAPAEVETPADERGEGPDPADEPVSESGRTSSRPDDPPAAEEPERASAPDGD